MTRSRTRSARAVSAVLFFVAPLAEAAVAAGDPIDDQRLQISSAQRDIDLLSARLTSLLARYEDVSLQKDSAAGTLGFNRVRMDKASRRMQQARARLNHRARKAYMTGVGHNADIVMSVGEPRKLLVLSKFAGESLRKDLDVIRDLEAAREASRAAASSAQEQSQLLASSTEQLEQLRMEIQSTIGSRQQALARATAELTRLQGERKKRELRAKQQPKILPAGPVSVARSRRQAELDVKLKNLLNWYAPGTGPASYTPSRLSPTGITTTGIASWYGPGFHGRRASSGATYDQNQLTAASLVLPFGTLVKVTYKDRSAVVVITDRGPYVSPRVIDLSAATAQSLGLGLGQVTMEILVPKGNAPAFP